MEATSPSTPPRRVRPGVVVVSFLIVGAIVVWSASRASRYVRNVQVRGIRSASVKLKRDERANKKARVKAEVARAETGKHVQTDEDRRRAEFQRLQGLIEPFTWSGMLSLADAYAHGSFPHFRPDEDVAAVLYRECSRAPDPEIAGLAQQRFVQIRTVGPAVDAADTDPAAEPIPMALADAARAHAAAAALTTVASTRPRWHSLWARPRERDISNTTTTIMHRLGLAHIRAAGDAAREEWGAERERDHRNDSQNVHDHTIARTTKLNLGNMERSLEVGERVGRSESAEQVTDFLLTNDKWSAEAKVDALEVLDSLNDEHNESAGTSQLGALATVWSALHRIASPDKRRDVRDTLVDQLVSAKENGKIVCSTGRIARIAGAMDGLEDGDLGAAVQPIRPMWAVREEIATLAARVRDEHAGENADDASEDQSPASKDFERKARAEYIDKLGFSPAVMEPLVREYAEHL